MRVDLVDPGSEGLELEAALVAAGHEVTVREVGALASTEADLVVLAGDAPGALEALRHLRDDGRRPDTLVVLVGVPPGLEPRAEGPAFGAEWAIGRADAGARLGRIVFEVAARATSKGPTRGLRERTLDLGAEESQVSRLGSQSDGSRRVARISDVAPAPEPGSGEHVLRAPISLELEATLRAGAARAFPDAALVDVSLPAGEDAAVDLVPDEFIARSPLDEGEGEPAGDSLTFVGGPPPLTPARPRAPVTRASSPPPARTVAVTEGTRSSLPTGSSPPPRPYAGGAREREPATTGAEPLLSGGGGVRELLGALFALAREDAQRSVEIVAGTLTVELELRGGVLVGLRGPIGSRVLTALGQAPAATETDAAVRLDALVYGGLVSRATRVREETRARRALLDELVSASECRWTERTRERSSSSSERALPLPLARELHDAASRGIDLARATALVGGPTARLVRRSRYPILASALGAPIELEAVLGESGMGIGRLGSVLEDVPGLGGSLVALLGAGALDVEGIDPEIPEDLAARARARVTVEAARRLADEGDYFAILGLRPRAGAAEVDAAFREEAARLRALDLDALGLGGLGPDRDVALAALAEAARVLGREGWREAYARGLLS